MPKTKTYRQLITGSTLLVLGIAMLFFQQTHNIGPFLIGFGISYGATGIKGDK